MNQFINEATSSLLVIIFIAFLISLPMAYFGHTFNGEPAFPYVLREWIENLKDKYLRHNV